MRITGCSIAALGLVAGLYGTLCVPVSWSGAQVGELFPRDLEWRWLCDRSEWPHRNRATRFEVGNPADVPTASFVRPNASDLLLCPQPARVVRGTFCMGPDVRTGIPVGRDDRVFCFAGDARLTVWDVGPPRVAWRVLLVEVTGLALLVATLGGLAILWRRSRVATPAIAFVTFVCGATLWVPATAETAWGGLTLVEALGPSGGADPAAVVEPRPIWSLGGHVVCRPCAVSNCRCIEELSSPWANSSRPPPTLPWRLHWPSYLRRLGLLSLIAVALGWLLGVRTRRLLAREQRA